MRVGLAMSISSIVRARNEAWETRGRAEHKILTGAAAPCPGGAVQEWVAAAAEDDDLKNTHDTKSMEKMMKKLLFLVLMFAAAFAGTGSAEVSKEDAVKAYQGAEKAYQDASMELQRIDLRKQKRTLIEHAVPLNEEQKKTFWPVYDKYEKQLIEINDQRLAMIKDYAAHYEKMTDEKAAELIMKSVDFQEKRLDARKTYLNDLKTILPPKMVARLLQLENQTDLLIDLQIASEVPLVK